MTKKTYYRAPYEGPPITLEDLTIEDYSFEEASKKPPTKGKYDDLFDTLEPGQRLKCPPRSSNAMSNVLRTYLRRRGIEHRIRYISVCHDGFGGVWWFRPEDAPHSTNRGAKNPTKKRVKTTLAPNSPWAFGQGD